MSLNEQLEMGETRTSKRIASLDFQRGLAIWMMTLLHAAANMYDTSLIDEDPNNILNLGIGVIILIAILGVFAIWNSYFLIISATVNSLAFSRRIISGGNPEQGLLKQLLAGFGLLFVNMIDNSFLYSGYFGSAIRNGDWSNTYPLWRGFFEMGTLRIIAFSMIINSIMLYFMLRKDGYKKYIRNMVIFGSLALIVIIASPFVHLGVDNIPWEIPSILPTGVDLGNDPSWPNVDFQALNYSFKSWILTIFAGDIQPLFPYLATSFFGAMIGLTLARPQPVKKFPLIGGLSGVGCLGVGGIFAALGFISFGNERPPTGNYFLLFGGQICTMFLFLFLVEYRGKSQKFGNNRVVKHFRKWGMISLTIYTLQIFELVPRFVLGSLYNLIFSTNRAFVSGSVFGVGEEWKTILWAFVVMLFFELFVFIWSKINFIGSFEWIITSIIRLSTKQSSYRLNYKVMMNKIEWMNYKQMLLDSDSNQKLAELVD